MEVWGEITPLSSQPEAGRTRRAGGPTVAALHRRWLSYSWGPTRPRPMWALQSCMCPIPGSPPMTGSPRLRRLSAGCRRTYTGA